MIERAIRAALADSKLHLLSVFSVAVAFVCLAATLLLAVNIDGVREKWSASGRASVYLRPQVDVETVQAVRQALIASEGVVRVEYLSSEQARADVIASSTDEALAALPSDAFPASLEVTLQDAQAVQRLEKLSMQLKALPAVESVETYKAWGNRLDELLSGGVTAALVLLSVVLAAVVSVVGSTMRMALSRRRAEVEVVKMVGATDSYVRGPFVLEGAAQGGLGALCALLLLGGLYLILRDSFDGALGTLIGVNPRFLPLTACLGLIVVGSAIGAVSAYASLRRLIGSFV